MDLMEHRVEIDVYRSILPMADWCNENIGVIHKEWMCRTGGGAPSVFGFLLEENAMAFKLRWS